MLTQTVDNLHSRHLVLLHGNGKGLHRHVSYSPEILRNTSSGESRKSVRPSNPPCLYDNSVDILYPPDSAYRTLAAALRRDLLQRLPEVQGTDTDSLGGPEKGIRDTEDVQTSDCRRNSKLRRRLRGLHIPDEESPSNALSASVPRQLSSRVSQDQRLLSDVQTTARLHLRRGRIVDFCQTSLLDTRSSYTACRSVILL